MNTLTPDQIPEKWGDIAAAYGEAFETLTSQFADEVISRLSPKTGETVLDVAAGTGSFSLRAAKLGADVLATDFAEGMVEHIQQRIDGALIHNIRTQVMDGQALDVVDASYDMSVSIVGLIFFPDIDKGFAELKRVLKPGGRCAVVCWDHPENFDMMRLLKQSIATAVPDFEMPVQTPVWARMVGEDALKEKFQQAGFNEVGITTIDGLLTLDSVEDFWSVFISSSPPMSALFSSLGEENTERVGREFVRLATDDHKNKVVTLASKACVGIAYA
ncbi:MAG TPA: methyltransferase domain-containing protein [Gammaproteobacteria bacterium]|nr:methyltransferase domain-containing protein [Gammaproteobacteria bacterium]